MVEEWLRRQGYFTQRGVKLGNDEIDLLAIWPTPTGLERRHIEVSANVRPISYLCPLPKALAGERSRSGMTRTDAEGVAAVAAWVGKKFEHPAKRALMQRLAPGPWTSELVVNKLKFEAELDLIRARGITIHRLRDVVRELRRADTVVTSATGGHLVDLIDTLDSAEAGVPPHVTTTA